MDNRKNDERRRYFRINDTIGLRYCYLERDAASLPVSSAQQSTRGLKNVLSVQEQRLQQLINVLQKKDIHVAEALGVLNKKINILASYLEVERGRVDEVEYLTRHVNISACGLAFITDEEVAIDSYLGLELLLSGEMSPLQLRGTVVGCRKNSKNQYYVRVDYDNIDGADQEALIQYMLKRQSEQMREKLSRRPSQLMN